MNYRMRVAVLMVVGTVVMASIAIGVNHFYPDGRDSPRWLDRVIGTTGLMYAIYMFMCVKELIKPSVHKEEKSGE